MRTRYDARLKNMNNHVGYVIIRLAIPHHHAESMARLYYARRDEISRSLFKYRHAGGSSVLRDSFAKATGYRHD